MGKATAAVLATVTVLAALVTPRLTLPKDSESGATENVTITPVPDNDTVFVPAPLPAFTRFQPIIELAFSRRLNLHTADRRAYRTPCPAPLERSLVCSLPV